MKEEKQYPQNPTNLPQRANVPNPDVFERAEKPRTTAIVPPGSAFGHTSGGFNVPVFDTNTGEPLPGITIFKT